MNKIESMHLFYWVLQTIAATAKMKTSTQNEIFFKNRNSYAAFEGHQ